MIDNPNKIQQNVVLAPFTTFKVGGSAEFFVNVKDKDDLTDALAWREANDLPITFFSGGSNILINDRGIKGLVVRLSNNQIEVKSERLVCGAGANLIQAANFASAAGLSGLEWAIGIPGSVGGAVKGNSGAHGGSIADNIELVECLNIKNRQSVILSRRDCSFGYKNSLFVNSPHLLIWQATFKLVHGDQARIKQLVDKNIQSRLATQPKLPSAGCVFKNLTIKRLNDFNQELALEAEESGLVRQGMVGAGWLIDLLGLKGKSIGGAKISLEHANFIVNTGKATAEDIVMLISFIKQQVRSKLKVQLEEEIQYLGF